ncbi:DUF982 domain-containing protein [Agrobacterium rhizogenes]|nr:DUF982 domain-containing protein [Rhizobium rhizogenes]NTJ78135.1 DUF982 domain-containing protein [Rhizobium rhizogenes]
MLTIVPVLNIVRERLSSGTFESWRRSCCRRIAMTQQLWSKPVTVETSKPGQRLTIVNTEAATCYLLRHWPAKSHGIAFKNAKRTLISAHEGHVEALAARAAFLAALEEGGVEIFEA